jgi:imidazolonepropionase-like amidohydrolase
VRSGKEISVQERPENVVVRDGKLVCSGPCSAYLSDDKKADIIDLDGGSIVPGLTTYGTSLGLVEIRLEPSTADGTVFNPIERDLPTILGDDLVRAIDGLQFGGRGTL